MIEKDKLSLFFSNEFPFNKEGLEEFINSFASKHYSKGHILLKNGKAENELRFLDEGVVREYYSNESKEKNINFYLDSEFITDFYSFVSEKPTNKYQECITDIKLRVISKGSFQEFLSKYMCGKLFVDEIFQRIIERKEKDLMRQFMNTAEENYNELIQYKPNWLQQIPQYHIASYLGVTPETLSRIRKRIS
ncbi:Crp/Fnr family transcriptional regulator [Emticicia oligotrophica]|uniref:Crp/Fnr family transcriptional regulator n=1 Tax=Emticicia oligotrophica TaxID=312279 RepID=UPI00273B410F|nr:Crp/Fnr family transcriptional regulator [Emticicia oligotrophica]